MQMIMDIDVEFCASTARTAILAVTDESCLLQGCIQYSASFRFSKCMKEAWRICRQLLLTFPTAKLPIAANVSKQMQTAI